MAERSSDGRWMVADGPRCRAEDPGLEPDVRGALVSEPMAARRAVRAATRAEDADAPGPVPHRTYVLRWWRRSMDEGAAMAFVRWHYRDGTYVRSHFRHRQRFGPGTGQRPLLALVSGGSRRPWRTPRLPSDAPERPTLHHFAAQTALQLHEA